MRTKFEVAVSGAYAYDGRDGEFVDVIVEVVGTKVVEEWRGVPFSKVTQSFAYDQAGKAAAHYNAKQPKLKTLNRLIHAAGGFFAPRG